MGQDGLTRLFIHNPNPSPLPLRKGTYIIDFVLPPGRIGAVPELAVIPPSQPLDEAAYADKVQNALPAYLTNVEYPDIKDNLTKLLTQYH